MRKTRHHLALLSAAAVLLPVLGVAGAVAGAGSAFADRPIVTAVSMGISPDGHPVYGEHLTVSGDVVYQPNSGPQQGISDAAVTLQRELPGASWTDVADQSASSQGHYSFPVTATRNAEYRVAYAGDATYAPSTSDAMKVLVSRKLHDRETEPHPGRFRLVGNVDPGWANKRLDLYRKRCGSCSWKVFDHQRTTTSGGFRFALPLPKKPGRWSFKVVVPKTSSYVRTASATYVALTRR